jgi:hypothetical protein
VDDPRFARQEAIEEIFAGTSDNDEELPYQPSFDQHALAFDLKPGDVISWPQNAPHRVTNLGTINVSLSTGLSTIASEQRTLIFLANRFFRRRLGIPVRSTEQAGLAAAVKCFTYRASRRAGLVRTAQRTPYQPKLRIDPEAPLGVRPC